MMQMAPFAGLAALALAGTAASPWWPAASVALLPQASGVELPVSIVQPFTAAGFGLLLLAAFLALWRTLERRTEQNLAAYKDAAAAQVAAYRERQEADRRQNDALQTAYLTAAGIAEAQRSQWAAAIKGYEDLRDQIQDQGVERQAQIDEFAENVRAEHQTTTQRLDLLSHATARIEATLAERWRHSAPSRGQRDGTRDGARDGTRDGTVSEP